MDANSDSLRQQIVDEEHLKLLRIGYLISAAGSGLFSLLGLFYGFMGTLLAELSPAYQLRGNQQAPELVALFFAIFGFGFTLVMLILAAVKLGVARCLRLRRGRLFCMIIAGICCLGIPYGTLLGVCTFILLARPSVCRSFTAAVPPAESTTTS